MVTVSPPTVTSVIEMSLSSDGGGGDTRVEAEDAGYDATDSGVAKKAAEVPFRDR